MSVAAVHCAAKDAENAFVKVKMAHLSRTSLRNDSWSNSCFVVVHVLDSDFVERKRIAVDCETD